MVRYSTVALIIVACLGALGCQKYTTGLQQSLARADEAVVVSTLRSITLAQRQYSLTNDGYGTFQQLTEGGYLDPRISGDKPVVKDYVLTMTVTPITSNSPQGFYSVNANPERSGDRAGRYFYIDSNSPQIHVNATQPATVTDEALQP